MATTRRTVTSSILSLSLALIFASPAHAQEHDLWFLVIQNEKPISSSRVQVHASPADSEGAAFRYVWNTHVPVNFMGRHQDITISTELLVSADLRPVSMRSENAGLSGSSTIRGELVGDTLTVITIEDDVKSTAVSTVSEKLPLLFDSCLGEWLGKQPAETTSVTVQVIDDSTWDLASVTATALEPADGRRPWHIDYGDETYTMTMQLGADGFEWERTYENIATRMRRCTEEEAAALAPIDMTGAAVLAFPVEPPINAPHRLTDLTVELRWRDIAFDEFEFEDDRQRLLEHAQDEAGDRVLVNISAPTPLELDVPFPVRTPRGGEDMRPFLAETEYVKPHHVGIREVALEVTDGKATAVEAVQALSTWVYRYIDGALIAETLTGPQVLLRKTGKCTEYSTLFASLARSAGIPTRMALGERMVANQWGGHMWNEVWVGRWVTVDASVDEVGGSFALLKFIHSDTVEGTQPIRRALPASLSIRVHDFETADSELAEAYETGIDGSTYTSVDFECRVTAPQPTWVLHDDSTSGVATIRFEIPEAESAFVHFVAFGLPPGTPPKALAVSRFELFRPNYDDFEILVNEPITVGDSPGHTTTFRGFAKGSEVESCITEVIWTQGSFGYIQNMIATRADHDAQREVFDELLASFEVLGAK